jgi:hypothetical protein
MNRTMLVTAAAFATITGCAEGYDKDGGAISTARFANIDRSITLTPLATTGFGFPANDPQTDTSWAPADLPIGAYWMTIHAVDAVKGGADLVVGSRQLTAVTEVDGVAMLQGIAPILAEGDELRADQFDSYVTPKEDGRCEIVSALSAEGYRGGHDVFKMNIEIQDTITGEDCEKLGYGEQKSELVAFAATFEFIPPVADEDDGGFGPSNSGDDTTQN